MNETPTAVWVIGALLLVALLIALFVDPVASWIVVVLYR